jgi:hypothetical protein
MKEKTRLEKYCEKLAFSDQPIDQLDDDVFARDVAVDSLIKSVFFSRLYKKQTNYCWAGWAMGHWKVVTTEFARGKDIEGITEFNCCAVQSLAS